MRRSHRSNRECAGYGPERRWSRVISPAATSRRPGSARPTDCGSAGCICIVEEEIRHRFSELYLVHYGSQSHRRHRTHSRSRRARSQKAHDYPAVVLLLVIWTDSMLAFRIFTQITPLVLIAILSLIEE